MPSPISTLLAWYKRNKRDLAWRRTKNPYRILISEVMLQQTQVDRVKQFYPRWLKQFPDWKALANAKTDSLLHAWAGLGYNRRALMLREAARQVVKYGVPTSIGAWSALKGVGPYTAAAVYGFSEQKRTIAIDTNVRRVAGRLFLGLPYPSMEDDGRLIRALEKKIPQKDRVWEWPQAMMDLGSSMCTSKNPSCAVCPLRDDCRAAKKFLHGRAGEKPKRISRESRHDEKPFPDRIYRGRILAALRAHRSLTLMKIATYVDPTFDDTRDGAWLQAMIERLKKDGMVIQTKHSFSLSKV